MGNCLTSVTSPSRGKSLPIDTIFNLPSPLPSLPAGGGFASGVIDLGGLLVSQISSFTKIWSIDKGGPDGLGATFFEPSSIRDGFSMLGCYSQPNNQQLFGWVLVGKDDTNNSAQSSLIRPIDYTLVWSSESSTTNKNGDGYIWLPTPPDGYKAVGHVVTTSSEKPPLDKIRCVRSDLTDDSQIDTWIWGHDTEINASEFNVYGLKPRNRGTQAHGVSVGTFIAQDGTQNATSTLSIACLKNNNFNTFSSMPSKLQIEVLFQAYSPYIYFHPEEPYLPSSVTWYFNNGALLYKKGEESKPVPIDPTGSNLPQGGSNDGEYWLDLPIDENSKERVKQGELQSTEAYLHIKPMLGATFTDIAMWFFYPYNGPSRAKIGLIDVPLGKIGEHVGDWEHLTLRVSNFNRVLYRFYLSEHSRGKWVDAPLLEFHNSTNKPVAYSSLHGHAFYSKPGLVMQGTSVIGIRNDAAKSDKVMDTGAKYSIVAGEIGEAIVEPSWLNYYRKWGPNITYVLGVEIEKVEGSLSGDLKSGFERVVNLLPKEVFEEDGPTGPKMKDFWNGDER